MYTKEEYENLINNSPLFGIDKETSPVLYKTERYAFLAHLCDYCRTYIYPGRPLESYSMTLMETAVECIKYHDCNKGEFLHLFLKAMRRDLGIEKAKEFIDKQRQGIRLSRDDDRLIRKIMSFASSKGLDIADVAIQEKIAKVLVIDVNKVRALIRINTDAVTVSNVVKDDEGNESDLIDLQAGKAKSIEDKLVEESAINELVCKIESVFSSVQTRQKRLLSMLITAEIIKAFDGDIERSLKVLNGKEIISREVTDYCAEHGDLPTAKQIGEWCQVAEQSVSRTYKNFKEKLRKKG